MKGIPSPYWLTDPGSMAKKELVRLNPADRDVDGRLTQLRTDRVRGILLVTKVVNEDGTHNLPFLTVVAAAPPVATFTKPLHDNGVLYEDVWEVEVLD
jgi:hypothetical protein